MGLEVVDKYVELALSSQLLALYSKTLAISEIGTFIRGKPDDGRIVTQEAQMR